VYCVAVIFKHLLIIVLLDYSRCRPVQFCLLLFVGANRSPIQASGVRQSGYFAFLCMLLQRGNAYFVCAYCLRVGQIDQALHPL